MNTKTYSNETITAYLLGFLPEAEAEIFDELSFTDDDFANELTAAEKDLVDAYVNGELQDEKLQKFKSFYLASPLRREKVEFANAFQTFAEKESAEKSVVAAKPKRTWAGFFSNIFTIPRSSLQWGFAAAALALMFFGVWLFWENSRLRSEISQTQSNRDELLKRESELQQREKQLQDEIANQQNVNSETEKELAQIREEREKLEQELKKSQDQKRINDQQRLTEQRTETKKQPTSSPNRQISIASFILTPSLRDNNQLQTVSIPSGTNSVAMQLELESDDYASYRVALRNQSNGQVLWQSGKLKSKTRGANKVLNVGFSSNLLKSQVYSLEVSGILADGRAEIVSDYSFRVVR